MALAHAIANQAEAAYRRGDLFEKRRKLMEAWAAYATTPNSAKVVQLIKQMQGQSHNAPNRGLIRACRTAD